MKKVLFLLGLLALFGVLAAVWLVDAEMLRAAAVSLHQNFTEAVRAHPSLLMWAMGVLVSLGCPLSIICIVAGMTCGFATAMLWLSLGLVLHLIFAYTIAAKYLQGFVARMATKLNYTLPKLSSTRQWQFVGLLRIAPIPTFSRSYILGAFGVAFVPYFVLSLPLEIAWAAGYVLFGDALMSGAFSYLLVAIVCFVALLLLAKYLRAKYA